MGCASAAGGGSGDGSKCNKCFAKSRHVETISAADIFGLLILIAVAAIAGASYQAIENHADASRFPQQGKSIALGPDFGDLHLNLDCQGAGSPTVVLDSGLGVPGIGWNRVQAEAAKFTR